MPIYQYACKCGERFEKKYPVKDTADYTQCECGKLAKKVPSVSTFIMRW